MPSYYYDLCTSIRMMCIQRLFMVRLSKMMPPISIFSVAVSFIMIRIIKSSITGSTSHHIDRNFAHPFCCDKTCDGTLYLWTMVDVLYNNEFKYYLNLKKYVLPHISLYSYKKKGIIVKIVVITGPILVSYNYLGRAMTFNKLLGKSQTIVCPYKN